MIGLGIDTGGTCTDAVLYDLDRQHVLSRGKTPTTKACLETGIARAIQKLDSATLQKIAFVSLSTTLATNACVENRGAAVKLLFIGVDEATVREQHQKYGFTCMDDLIFIDGIPPGGFCKPKAPDWDALEHQLDAFKGAEAIGIVQYFPEWNQGAYEKKARDILSQKTDVPIVCGSELFSDLNAIRRGAGTYLNVRLIPIIQSFLTAVKNVLNAMALPVPLYIVRSDGSLMSEAFAQSHPVETLLSGPAASATGGAWMSEAQNAIVVDIGGTTTDIALIQDGLPVTLKEGITINGWKTFVKGLFIDTFGLGGDSAVRFNGRDIVLEPFRVVPIAVAANRYSELTARLKRLSLPAHKKDSLALEGFLLQKDPGTASLSARQLALCAALKKHPLFCSEAAVLCCDTKPLEANGTIIRFGLTPTDVMHVCQDYTDFNREASKAALAFFSKCSHIPLPALPGHIYDAFLKKLYTHLVQVLLKRNLPSSVPELSTDLKALIANSYDGGFPEITAGFHSGFSLIGAGGPAHLFIPGTAKKLGCEVLIHKDAMVANAIGTLAGRITVQESLELMLCCDNDKEGYRLYIDGEKHIVEAFPEAVSLATSALSRITARQAESRGAALPLDTTRQIEIYPSGPADMSRPLGAKIIMRAVGSIDYTKKER